MSLFLFFFVFFKRLGCLVLMSVGPPSYGLFIVQMGLLWTSFQHQSHFRRCFYTACIGSVVPCLQRVEDMFSRTCPCPVTEPVITAVTHKSVTELGKIITLMMGSRYLLFYEYPSGFLSVALSFPFLALIIILFRASLWDSLWRLCWI